MKPWKTVSLILTAVVVIAAGYGVTLVRRGFSARAEPSSIETLLRNDRTQNGRAIQLSPASQSLPTFDGKCSGRHGTFL